MSKREKKVVRKCSLKKNRVFSLFKTLLAEKNKMLLNNQKESIPSSLILF